MKLGKKCKDGLYTGSIETTGDAINLIENMPIKTNKKTYLYIPKKVLNILNNK